MSRVPCFWHFGARLWSRENVYSQTPPNVFSPEQWSETHSPLSVHEEWGNERHPAPLALCLTY